MLMSKIFREKGATFSTASSIQTRNPAVNSRDLGATAQC